MSSRKKPAGKTQRSDRRVRGPSTGPTDVGVHRTGNSAAPASRASAGDRGEKPPTIPLGETRAQSGKSRLKDGCSQDWLPHKDAVFHGISRAEGPFKQGRKTTPGGRSPR
jgi:hypothetical protein